MYLKIILIICVVADFCIFGTNTLEVGDSPCPETEKVCRFNFTVSTKESMTLEDLNRETAIPIVPDGNDGFCERKTNCSCLNFNRDFDAEKVIIVDGAHRTTTVVNGQLPGPAIVVYHGAEVIVRVKNNLLMEGITIHWHGMTQQGTPWMDGVGRVSQCPINPGESFTYKFIASNIGTHWYHSHLGVQRTDGLYGPLIVLPTKEEKKKQEEARTLPQFTKDFIVAAQDWFRDDSLDIYHRTQWELLRFSNGDFKDKTSCYWSNIQSDGSEVSPYPFNSAIINGKGWKLTGTTIENSNIPLEVFPVTKDGFFRFRVIGAQLLHPFRLSIDEHTLFVFASDSNEIKPIEVEYLIINTGERFDFYINTTMPVRTYLMRLETLEQYYRTMGGQDPDDLSNPAKETVDSYEKGRVGFALVKYDGSQNEVSQNLASNRSCTATLKCRVFNCPFGEYADRLNLTCVSIAEATNAFNVTPPSIPQDKSNFEEYFLNFHFSGYDKNNIRKLSGAQRSSVNGREMVMPSAPPQVYGDKGSHIDECATDGTCERNHCRCTFFVPLKKDSIVQLVLINMGTGSGRAGTAHPVHIHGHHFHVMKMAFPEYTPGLKLLPNNLLPHSDVKCDYLEDLGYHCNNASWNETALVNGTIPGLNEVDPPLKDTVIVPVGGYVVIRFKADNPGWWFAHCHIEIHQAEGMAFMFKEGEQSDMQRPPRGFPSCGNFDYTDEEEIPVACKADRTTTGHILSVFVIMAYFMETLF